jgi:hypothetical protein
MLFNPLSPQGWRSGLFEVEEEAVGSGWSGVDRARMSWDCEGSGCHCLKSTRRRLLLGGEEEGEGEEEEEEEGKEGDWASETVESKSRS